MKEGKLNHVASGESGVNESDLKSFLETSDPKADRVVRRVNQILLGPEVSLGRLNRRVAQQHLDLLKLAAGGAAQLRARASQIVRRDAGNADLGRVLLGASARRPSRPGARR